MSTREQNDFLTQTGPGTPIGNLFRRYWIPALLSAEVPEPDCPPVRVKLLSERLLAFRDTQGRVGRDRRVLRPPRRVALVRPQRGERAALPLSRLEIRRHRPVHRGAVRAGGERLLQEDQADVLSVRRAGRRDLDLYGAGGAQAAAACLRMGKGAAFASLRVEAHAGVQLPAGDGGRHRFGACLVPSSPRAAQRPAPCRQGRRADARNRRALRSGRDQRRHGDRRAPPGRGGSSLLAHHAMDHAVPQHDPALWRQRAQRPCLGADRRRELHVVVLHPPSDAPAVRARAPYHAQRRRHPRQADPRQLPAGGQQGQRLHDRPCRPERRTRPTAASPASRCRTRRSRKAWARSRTAARRTWSPPTTA